MRKVIIVEGKQDAAFVKVLAPDLEVREIELKELEGGGKNHQDTLRKALKAIQNDNQFNPVDKIGILLDLDPGDFTVESRLAFVNECTEIVFGIKLESINAFRQASDLQLACHFIQPNLDVLLRKIAAKPSPRADCLHACLASQENAKQKESEKAWPLYYMRWDICDFAERANGAKNVSFNYTHSKGAWNIEAPDLAELKAFLSLF